jgi:hypothetical protein
MKAYSTRAPSPSATLFRQNHSPPQLLVQRVVALYLLNADTRISPLVLRSNPPASAGRVDIIGELRDLVPLPWLACFTASDLVECDVELTSADGSSRVEKLLSPCAPIETALINLIRSRPFFERLTGEKILAEEYWRRAVNELKRHKRAYLAIDYADLVGFSEIEEVNSTAREGLSWTDEGFNALTDLFLAWAPGVRPLGPAQLDGAPVDARFLNGMSLDINTMSPDDVYGIGD